MKKLFLMRVLCTDLLGYHARLNVAKEGYFVVDHPVDSLVGGKGTLIRKSIFLIIRLVNVTKGTQLTSKRYL